MSTPEHKPVLLEPVLNSFDYVTEKPAAIFIDGTLGLGGHSLAIAKRFKVPNLSFIIIGIDKDEEALKIAGDKIEKAGLNSFFNLVHDDFHNISQVLYDLSIDKIDGVLLDLGVSSMQLDDKTRGFSFTDPSMPLDMRMDRSQALSALDIVNDYSEEELERVLRAGEERYFRRVAKAIIESRKVKPLKQVGDLLSVIAPVLKKGYSRTHFATDTFRAIRLEVNDEINSLETTIREIVECLNPGGRLAIISFHSIEDRIVKDVFRKLANPCTCPPKLPICVCGLRPEGSLVTRKPIIASEAEIHSNPRARSAKLRVIQKL